MDDFDRYESLQRQLEIAHRGRDSPVFKSTEEFRIEQEMSATYRRMHPDRVCIDDRQGPLSRLPSVDM